MTRALTFLAGPELVLAALTAAIYAFCARHNSHGGDDVKLLEKLLMLLPLIVVPLGFLTILGPGAKNWFWLGRVNLATLVCVSVAGMRIVNGFGSGAKGQDVGMMLVLSFAIALTTIANAVCGAMVLRAQKPAVAEWFRLHPIGGHALTALSTVPILVVQVIVSVIVVTLLVVIASAFEK